MKTISKMIALSALTVTSAQAYSPILRPFHSVRAAGMGDVRYTTGLYEENFFANPARMARIPENQFQLPKISIEAGSATIKSISTLTKGGSDGVSKFADVVGEPVSASVQMVFPAYYHHWESFALAIGMVVRTQTVAQVGQNSYVDPLTYVNAGPAITFAQKLLPENRLTVGVTGHAQAQGSSGSVIGLVDYFKGTEVKDIIEGGSSAGYDFDFGVSFKPHWNLGGFEYEIGGAVNNILGGKYNNIKKNLINGWDKQDPMYSRRSYSAGISAVHKNLPMFTQLTLAVEGTDFGNNENGSVFRNLHIGAEGVARIMTFRAGINQGYWTLGFGVDLGVFDLNLASYGEELGLNAGVQEDRRYAVEFGFQI